MIQRLTLTLLILMATPVAFAMGNHSAPKGSKDHNRFIKELRETYPVIALAPAELPQELRSQEAVDALEAELTRKLGFKEYTVIPAAVYAELWRKELEALGGIYDPITGQLIPENLLVAKARVRATMVESHDVDAFLETSVVERDAAYLGTVITYGGVKERAYVKGPSWGTSDVAMGVLRALFLTAELVTPEGNVIYKNAGGIQLRFKESRDDVVVTPVEELLSVQEYNRTAAHLALRGMLYDYRTLSRDIRARKTENARK